MTDNRDLRVEVRHQDIVVTMPGTSLRVVYRKPHRGSQNLRVGNLDYRLMADLPPAVAMPRFPGANEPCRKHAFAITLGYLTT